MSKGMERDCCLWNRARSLPAADEGMARFCEQRNGKQAPPVADEALYIAEHKRGQATIANANRGEKRARHSMIARIENERRLWRL